MHSCLNTVIASDLVQKGLYVMFELSFETCKFVSQKTNSMCRGMDIRNSTMCQGNCKQLYTDGISGKMKWQKRRVGTRS